jgi:amino-acid N-acetyltransferase
MSAPTLRLAAPGDIPTIEYLLKAEWLPPMQITEFLETFWVIEQAGQVVGCIGLEVYGEEGVLRSVVVASALRGTRQGERLTEKVIAEARQRGVKRLYLFTMSAAAFFPRFGFRAIAMEDFGPKGSWQYIGINTMPEMRDKIVPMRMDLA